jgi:hypothetical protein
MPNDGVIILPDLNFHSSNITIINDTNVRAVTVNDSDGNYVDSVIPGGGRSKYTMDRAQQKWINIDSYGATGGIGYPVLPVSINTDPQLAEGIQITYTGGAALAGSFPNSADGSGVLTLPVNGVVNITMPARQKVNSFLLKMGVAGAIYEMRITGQLTATSTPVNIGPFVGGTINVPGNTILKFHLFNINTYLTYSFRLQSTSVAGNPNITVFQLYGID